MAMMRALAPFRILSALSAGALLFAVAPSIAQTAPKAPASQPSPAPVPGGLIATLPMGTYTCELAGDAGGLAGKPVADHAFRVVNASSYKAGGFRGSYLYTGDIVTMTGGKLRGLKLHRVSSNMLRKIEPNGADGEMRCVRTSHK